MARGIARSPSQNAYRGALGRTQTTTVHVTTPRGDLVSAQVYTTIDAVSDPELVDRLHSDEPGRALNVIRIDGAPEPVRVAVPILYHDPAAELLVLILHETLRHRELEERIRVLERMREDDAAVPLYAKEFAVVFGAAGLRVYLEERAQAALESARSMEASRESDRRTLDLAARETELSRARTEHDRRVKELERRAIELDLAKAELAARVADIERSRLDLERLRSEQRNRVIAAVQTSDESTTVSAPPTAPDRSRDEIQTKPLTKAALDADGDEIPTGAQRPLDTNGVDSGVFEGILTGVANALDAIQSKEFDGEEETTGASIIPQGSDPLTTETSEQAMDVVTDAWLDKAAAHPTSTFGVVSASGNNQVRLALVAGEQLARGLGGALDVRVVMHRTSFGPLIAFVFGPPAALRVPSPTQLAVVPLDIAAEPDRLVLAALAKRFEIGVDIIVRGKRLRRAKLVAPLSDNVAYIVRAAEEHLRGVMADGDASYLRARDLALGAGFDLLGVEHSDSPEFRDDKLAQLETAQQLRRAIAMARRFSRPSREDYLVCTRGFPLPRWRELRHHVLESAVAWGLWMGPELAQLAVSEGLARSRRDLIVKMDRGFDMLRKHPTAFDIDGDAADDNAKALAEEARALGVEIQKGRNGTIASDEVSQVSGSIGGTPAHGIPRARTIEELIAALEDRPQRLGAALELCERGDPKAAAAVIDAASKMPRSEAVRVLGMSVKLGAAAKTPLMQGLASSKSFLRHGCALALALLRTEDGTQAVIDLLMTEPTEIWREVARAIGQVGPPALAPLASTFGRLGERATPVIAERVAWAMAHVAVRGGKVAIEQMANGQSVVAPVAKQALQLHGSAANDHVRVRPGAEGSQAGRDVTVNRAFSRRFFEALEQGLPDAGRDGLSALDASGPMEMLDEADLIEEEDEAELDESDLIQT